MSEYRMCKRCVMDTQGDPNIKFDNNGYCNYCTDALKKMPDTYFPNEIGKRKLETLFGKLKENGIEKKYDCFMGLSGGLDSAYLAYLAASQYGLRILALHIDDGFDTLIAKKNIEKLCNKANIDLITIKPDGEQFYDLTLSFIKASVPNIAIPQDNILFSCIYKYMEENEIDYFLSGGNFALESILQKGNTHDAYDKKHIFNIQKRFGTKPIDKLPIISSYERYVKLPSKKNITTIYPLNFIDYNRIRALEELFNYCEFEYYGAKHWESSFTKFMQTYYLVRKFNVDKRKSHLSSMIVSNQLSREEALNELNIPPYTRENIEKDIQLITQKLNITEEYYNQLIERPSKTHSEYKISKNLWKYPVEFIRRIKMFVS